MISRRTVCNARAARREDQRGVPASCAGEQGDESFGHYGAVVAIETGNGEIVLIHPAGGTLDATASLPGDPRVPGEAPETAAGRIAKEKTGLDVVVDRELATFIQPGAPTGAMCAHGHVAHVISGALLAEGPEGPATSYPLSALPGILPIRVATQKTIDAHLAQRGQRC